jgi:hypothetical protein
MLGTANKRFFHGPGINNFDVALLKDTHITESKVLQVRFEFFNVFNHVQFQNPTGSILNGTFGFVTSANAPRIGQVAPEVLVLTRARWPRGLRFILSHTGAWRPLSRSAQ